MILQNYIFKNDFFKTKNWLRAFFLDFSGCLRPIPHEKSINHFLSSNEIERPLKYCAPPPPRGILGDTKKELNQKRTLLEKGAHEKGTGTKI